jgi:hypothetical protein
MNDTDAPTPAVLKIMPVEPCGAVGRCMSHPSSYKNDATPRYGREPDKKRIAEFALARLAEARKIDEDRHAANLPAIENNRLIAERIKSLMTEVGMPVSYAEVDPKSRARFPKKQRHDAGYLEDIRRHVRTNDGFDSATSTYVRLKAAYDAYAEEGEREAAAAKLHAEQAEERAKAERRANIEMATIILRYGLDTDSTWSEILEALRTKDQRLDLAVAMVDTRGDWSEGFYRVSDAFGRFKIETEEDKQIANDIAQCLATAEDGCDGRVFRDTTWSYDRLFASVTDQQLATDVQTAREKARGDD